VAKVTARVTVRGSDLAAMIAEAEQQFSDLSPDGEWTIAEVDLWGSEDVASRGGMTVLWSATITGETSVE